MSEIADWFAARAIVTETGCWEWQGAVLGKGYGKFKKDGKFWLAHRYSYTMYKGPIPDGLVIRHKCHNVLCVNPDHLQTGTHRDNVWDQIERGTLNPPNGPCKPIEFYRGLKDA